MTASENAPEIMLRPADITDSRLLWEWRNEPAAREASFNVAPITFEEHESWLVRKLSDPKTRIFIGLREDGEPFGYARYDLLTDEAEISVSIDKNIRGRQYGSQLIRICSEHVLLTEQLRRIVAHVKSANAGSVAAFARAGFVPRSPQDGQKPDVLELVYTQA